PRPSRLRRWGRLIAKIGLNLTHQFDGEGPALAISRGPDRKAHPSLADAVFLNVVSLHALETHPNTALKQGGIVVGARRVGGQSVGRSVSHGRGLGSRGRRRGAPASGRAHLGHIVPSSVSQTFSPARAPSPLTHRGLFYSRGHSAAPAWVTAPSRAGPTSRAYFSRTPARRWGGRGRYSARRRASSASPIINSIRRSAQSTRPGSPASTSAMGPPTAASGPT